MARRPKKRIAAAKLADSSQPKDLSTGQQTDDAYSDDDAGHAHVGKVQDRSQADGRASLLSSEEQGPKEDRKQLPTNGLQDVNKVEEETMEGSAIRPVRVYADGIYDLFHLGHARSLEQAKKLFPDTYLMVGCCGDSTTHKYKGKTVMTEDERYESLRHCKWVDEVIKDAPWVVTQEFLDKYQIDYVAHDALPYADASGSSSDVYDFVKKAGKFKETKRTDGVSTSDLIMRIVKDYNQYVMRNLARGYSRKDMGVSYVMEKQLRMNMGIKKLQKDVQDTVQKNRAYFGRNVKAMTDNLNTVAKTAGKIGMRLTYTEWVENADKWVSGFLEKFEEGFHFMEKAIQTQITKNLIGPPNRKKLLGKGSTAGRQSANLSVSVDNSGSSNSEEASDEPSPSPDSTLVDKPGNVGAMAVEAQ
eukprot:jgi/Mesen1/3207/ME000185S02340